MSEAENEQPTPDQDLAADLVGDLADAIDMAAESVAVQASELEELDAPLPGTDGGDPEADSMSLTNLMDVPVQITVEVGRTRMSLGDLVSVRPGSLVELDREAHEPADILVNGKVVARGEIVTIDDTYGVRVTSVERRS